MKLYTYWRSQASFRVRIALRLKGLVAETISLDLLKGDQFDPTYRALNPEMVVPTLLDGDGPPLVQSLAILEYLEEKYPQPPLLPVDLRARAHVRALAQMPAMDAHPCATTQHNAMVAAPPSQRPSTVQSECRPRTTGEVTPPSTAP